MDTLFDIPDSPSPKKVWMDRHDYKVQRNKNMQAGEEPFDAWDAGLGVDPYDAFSKEGPYGMQSGESEDEALVNLALMQGIPLWNEEGVKLPSKPRADRESWKEIHFDNVEVSHGVRDERS